MAGRFQFKHLQGAALMLAAGLYLSPCAGAAFAQTASAVPVASEARIAGDKTQTRFILDLDRKIPVSAFMLADPYRLVLDVPEVSFQVDKKSGQQGRGLIKAFRYGLVMAGGSRIVFDLTGPAKVAKVDVLDATNDQPARLVVELASVDRTAFMSALAAQKSGKANPAQDNEEKASKEIAAVPDDASGDATKPLIVIDPGHGGIDSGTQAESGETEKEIVLEFALALRDRIEKTNKYRVVMTRSDDTFVPLGERVRIARKQNASLFVSIHADSLPRREGDANGATIYTLSEKASDAEAQRLADSENKADAIAGLDLAEEPTEVADILIDLVQRETKAFSYRFAHILKNEMKDVVRLHKRPLKSAGFKVLKAPDVPSVLVELGYVSNKSDLRRLVSDDWRARSVGAVAKAIDGFFSKRVVSAE